MNKQDIERKLKYYENNINQNILNNLDTLSDITIQLMITKLENAHFEIQSIYLKYLTHKNEINSKKAFS